MAAYLCQKCIIVNMSTIVHNYVHVIVNMTKSLLLSHVHAFFSTTGEPTGSQVISFLSSFARTLTVCCPKKWFGYPENMHAGLSAFLFFVCLVSLK